MVGGFDFFEIFSFAPRDVPMPLPHCSVLHSIELMNPIAFPPSPDAHAVRIAERNYQKRALGKRAFSGTEKGRGPPLKIGIRQK